MKKLLLFISVIIAAFSVNAQTDLIISEYVEGWSNNKALEIFNPTNAAIELSDYRITRYSNGSDVPPADEQWAVVLPEYSLEPYKTYVVVLDKRDPNGSGQEAPVWSQLQERADVFLCPVYAVSKAMYFNGDDGVALEKTDGTLVDLFARWGAPRPAEATVGGSELVLRCWTDTPPHFDGNGVGITADHTLIKKSSVNTGVTDNPTIWNPLTDWDTLSANTFLNLGWHVSDVSPANETPAFSQDSYIYSISSDSENGYEVATITANDAEGDALKYYINYGNFVYFGEEEDAIRIEPFALDKATGKLTVVDNSGLDAAVKDTFDLKVVVTDGFTQTEEVLVRILIDIEIGINSVAKLSKMKVYPNPSQNNKIQVLANKNINNISVRNIIGQEVYAVGNILQKSATLNLTSLPKGVYVINAHLTDNSVISSKVVFE